MVRKIFNTIEQFINGKNVTKMRRQESKKSVASSSRVVNIQPTNHEPTSSNSSLSEPHGSTSAMILKSFGITDVGLKRSHNEDNFYRSDELGIYLVADGMGGHAAGEVASNAAIQTIAEFVERFDKDKNITWPFGFDTRISEDGNALITGIQLANQNLCRMQQQKAELSGMGTTLAAMRITDDKALIAHVGDSRVYRMRGNAFEQLTSDHSWVNEQLQKNIITAEEARTHRYRNVITRALGNRTELEIDIRLEPVLPDDIFLICSDGLSGMLEDHTLEAILRTYPDSIRSAANTLVARANEAGGHDNISIVIVQCSLPEEA